MGTHGHHLAVVHKEDFIHLLNGGNPVGNQNGRLARTGLAEIVQNGPLGLGIHGGNAVVQNQNGCVPHQRPGNGNALLLAAGHGNAPLAQHRIIALSKFPDVGIHVGHPSG